MPYLSGRPHGQHTAITCGCLHGIRHAAQSEGEDLSFHRAGIPSLTCWTPLPRVAAFLNPVIDLFDAGGHSGLPRPELRVAADIWTGPRVDRPAPPRRRPLLNVKFCAAMPQDSSSSFRSVSDHRAGVPRTNHHRAAAFP
jgi:hypothetical protein